MESRWLAWFVPSSLRVRVAGRGKNEVKTDSLPTRASFSPQRVPILHKN